MNSHISENIWCSETGPVAVDILIELDPADWYELKETEAWKEVERLVRDLGSRDTLLRRLAELDLKERATTEQVQTALDLDPLAKVYTLPRTDTASTEQTCHSIWQRLKKWISGDATY